jgi:hypothetical protein
MAAFLAYARLGLARFIDDGTLLRPPTPPVFSRIDMSVWQPPCIPDTVSRG